MRTVVCFGDSNTYGASPIAPDGSWHRYGPEVRWPMRLATLLGADWHVVEEGLPGRTTCHDSPWDGPHKNGLRVLPSVLESHAPMDAIVVMLGTNDLKTHLALPAMDIARGLRSLLLRIRNSDAGPDKRPPRVLLVAPVPVDEVGHRAEMIAGGAAKSRRLAGFCAELGREFGCEVFDAGEVAEVSPVDGVHLTEASHLALAEAMAGRLRSMFGDGRA